MKNQKKSRLLILQAAEEIQNLKRNYNVNCVQQKKNTLHQSRQIMSRQLFFQNEYFPFEKRCCQIPTQDLCRPRRIC